MSVFCVCGILAQLTIVESLNFDPVEIQRGCHRDVEGAFGDWVATMEHRDDHFALAEEESRESTKNETMLEQCKKHQQNVRVYLNIHSDHMCQRTNQNVLVGCELCPSVCVCVFVCECG